MAWLAGSKHLRDSLQRSSGTVGLRSPGRGDTFGGYGSPNSTRASINHYLSNYDKSSSRRNRSARRVEDLDEIEDYQEDDTYNAREEEIEIDDNGSEQKTYNRAHRRYGSLKSQSDAKQPNRWDGRSRRRSGRPTRLLEEEDFLEELGDELQADGRRDLSNFDESEREIQIAEDEIEIEESDGESKGAGDTILEADDASISVGESEGNPDAEEIELEESGEERERGNTQGINAEGNRDGYYTGIVEVDDDVVEEAVSDIDDGMEPQLSHGDPNNITTAKLAEDITDYAEFQNQNIDQVGSSEPNDITVLQGSIGGSTVTTPKNKNKFKIAGGGEDSYSVTFEQDIKASPNTPEEDYSNDFEESKIYTKPKRRVSFKETPTPTPTPESKRISKSNRPVSEPSRTVSEPKLDAAPEPSEPEEMPSEPWEPSSKPRGLTSEPKIARSEPKMTRSEPKINGSEPKINGSEPRNAPPESNGLIKDDRRLQAATYVPPPIQAWGEAAAAAVAAAVVTASKTAMDAASPTQKELDELMEERYKALVQRLKDQEKAHQLHIELIEKKHQLRIAHLESKIQALESKFNTRPPPKPLQPPKIAKKQPDKKHTHTHIPPLYLYPASYPCYPMAVNPFGGPAASAALHDVPQASANTRGGYMFGEQMLSILRSIESCKTLLEAQAHEDTALGIIQNTFPDVDSVVEGEESGVRGPKPLTMKEALRLVDAEML